MRHGFVPGPCLCGHSSCSRPRHVQRGAETPDLVVCCCACGTTRVTTLQLRLGSSGCLAQGVQVCRSPKNGGLTDGHSPTPPDTTIQTHCQVVGVWYKLVLGCLVGGSPPCAGLHWCANACARPCGVCSYGRGLAPCVHPPTPPPELGGRVVVLSSPRRLPKYTVTNVCLLLRLGRPHLLVERILMRGELLALRQCHSGAACVLLASGRALQASHGHCCLLSGPVPGQLSVGTLLCVMQSTCGSSPACRQVASPVGDCRVVLVRTVTGLWKLWYILVIPLPFVCLCAASSVASRVWVGCWLEGLCNNTVITWLHLGHTYTSALIRSARWKLVPSALASTLWHRGKAQVQVGTLWSN